MRDIDLSAIRARLAGQSGPAFWRSLDEVAETPEFKAMLHREFPEGASEFTDPAGRRDFLRLMGASIALAGAAACTRQPTEHIVPYVKAPEDLVPGKPLFFATAMPFAGAAVPVLVESHMGRPTKIEPNPEHPFTRGGTDVYAQASVLELYDPDRSQTVMGKGEIRPWSEVALALNSAGAGQKGAGGVGLRILSGAVSSPTLAAQIQALRAAAPQAKWIQYEAIGRDNARAGARQAFGEYVEAQYKFDQADVVLSLDADVLDAGPGKLRYARDFANRRRVAPGQTAMNRLYVAESAPTNTGSKADHRLSLKAREVAPLARAIAAGLGVAGAAPAAGAGGQAPAHGAAFVAAVVKDLQAHKGRALVVAGDAQPPAVHALAHAMNAALGSVGTTVVYTATPEAVPSEGMAALRELVGEMNAGTVAVLVILGANPVFTAPADLQFHKAMSKVPLTVHLGLHRDETALHSQWHIPEAHYLETWSDARTCDGTVTICQPLIEPLYECHSAHEVIGALAGDVKTPLEYVQTFWKANWDGRAAGAFGKLTDPTGVDFASFEKFWRRSLHDGFVSGTAYAPKTVALAAGAVAPAAAEPETGGLEVTFRADGSVYDGRFANNGWLQELPKPFDKVCWDNVAWISPRTAETLGVKMRAPVVYGVEVHVAELAVGQYKLQVPLWIMPGQPDGSIALHLGYGRTAAGRIGNGLGYNANFFRYSATPWVLQGASLGLVDQIYNLASTQGHFQMEDRALLRVGTRSQYEHDPTFAQHMRHVPKADESMYAPWKYEGYAWGMAIDLNACNGCNACVVACVAENNIPVVGKLQVMKGREMHWLRIDRYWEGNVDAPSMHFQPVACQQCENAPCEVVCPVGATAHSDEGLNDMVYNRCVGTRYCSHNCPYKVRRFNFLLYADWDTKTLKMQRNPDVTVRSRGVMEKCTYCVQRINTARQQAKIEDRKIRDGEIVTACEAACPTQAIVFGDLNDKNSRVAKAHADPRSYGLLAELNTRPRTTYLAAVTNPNTELTPETAGPATGGHH
jgi:MoCo/4Fe-4S cofactor protein with predicted Tat translocation signal